MTDDDAYLFVFDNLGERANLFSLDDPLNPERLATLAEFWNANNPWRTNRCRFADVRGEAPSVDVLCPGLAYTARWDAEAERLAGTDWIGQRQGDRFNGIPAPDFGPPTGFAVAAADRYLYVATPGQGILIFGCGAPAADASTGPHLTVDSATIDDANPAPGATITLRATVRNRGGQDSEATTLRFYPSADVSISGGDTQVGSTSGAGIESSGTSDHSIELTVPEVPGSYYYGACIDSVTDESNVGNNCSVSVAVTVADGGAPSDPDLVVESPSVNDESLSPEGAFTLSVVVRNQGHGAALGTTLRYYPSSNASITTRDTKVGTDAMAGIAASKSANKSIDLTAPSEAGTYHYGACVDHVANESDVEKNCSDAVAVVVGGDEDSYCRDGDTVPTGGECDSYDTNFTFDVSASGTGCVRASGISLCSSGSHNYRNSTFNGVTITFVAQRNDDLSWAIEDVEPEPSD